MPSEALSVIQTLNARSPLSGMSDFMGTTTTMPKSTMRKFAENTTGEMMAF